MTDTLIDALGTKLYIGPKNTDDIVPASPDLWDLVGELASLGAIAFEANQERSTALTRTTDIVLKGVEPMPAIQITFNKISGGDDGQEALYTAQQDRTANQWYWFKEEMHDGTVVTYTAKVFGYTPWQAIGTTGVVQGGATLVVDSRLFVETPAS